MTGAMIDAAALSKEDVWREVIRCYVDVALWGNNKGLSDDELNFFLNPETPDHITRETKLASHKMVGPDGSDLSADSLDMVEAVMAIEERLGVEISEDDLNAAENAGDVLDIVWSLLHP